jgi:hypothetical protein
LLDEVPLPTVVIAIAAKELIILPQKLHLLGKLVVALGLPAGHHPCEAINLSENARLGKSAAR